jgi:hypothetical protein
MGSPASVANKRLMARLTPLDATLTKNSRGPAFGRTPTLPILEHTQPAAPRASFRHNLKSLFALNLQLSFAMGLRIEYRIEMKEHGRPAPSRPLQVRDA